MINTHRVLVLIMFCSRERFSQRICDIQIRMYFANIYVSILNIFADGVETTLDVPGLLVKPGLLCDVLPPRSVMNSFTQIASCAASEAAMYSASTQIRMTLSHKPDTCIC